MKGVNACKNDDIHHPNDIRQIFILNVAQERAVIGSNNKVSVECRFRYDRAEHVRPERTAILESKSRTPNERKNNLECSFKPYIIRIFT